MNSDYTLDQLITIGSIWRNNDPYDGECSFIIGLPVKSMPGYYECVMCDCIKYPGLKGQVEYKHKDALLKSYHKISD